MSKQQLGFGGGVGTGGGGGGGVTTSGLTVNKIPIATAASNIEDSPIEYVGTDFIFKNNSASIGSAGPPDPSSIVMMDSLTKGLLIPRMTVAQMLAIAGPVLGLLVFATNILPGLYFWNGLQWQYSSANVVASGPLTPGVIPVAGIGGTVIQDSAPVLQIVGFDFVVNTGIIVNLLTTPKIISNGIAPLIAVGPGLGGGVAVLAGNDLCGQITLTFGGVPVANAIAATITFNIAYGAAPLAVIVTQGGPLVNASTAQLHSPIGAVTPATFDINTGPVIAGLALAVVSLYYQVIQ